jgi:hypothetical protein
MKKRKPVRYISGALTQEQQLNPNDPDEPMKLDYLPSSKLEEIANGLEEKKNDHGDLEAMCDVIVDDE